jgi:hypothetical protein
MFDVIVSTISTGRVRRLTFDSYAEAQKTFDSYDAMRAVKSQARIYRVELVRRDVPAPVPVPVAEAA